MVIVGAKSYSLDEAMEQFAPAVGPMTVLLPILNGNRRLRYLVEPLYRDVCGEASGVHPAGAEGEQDHRGLAD